MRTGKPALVTLALFLGCAPALAAPGPIITLDLSEGWTYQTKDPWRVRVDHRDLLAMRHPWTPSAEGNFASAVRPVTVPADWRGPVCLTFYCSDDYHTDEWRPDGSWLTAEGYVGHRFRQILIDERVVWNADVSDPVVKGASPSYRIPIPTQPGNTFLLSLVVYDVVPSTTILEHDFYQPGESKTARETDPNAFNFQTHVYWGDLCLVDGDAEPRPGRRPVEAAVTTLHDKRWPLPPFGDSWKGPTVALEVSAPGGAPEQGFPAQCGLPVHAGRLTDLGHIRLRLEKQGAIPSQKRAIGWWPDESVKWVLFDFPVKPDTRSVKLDFKNDRATFPRQMKTVEDGSLWTVDTGPLQCALQPGDVASSIRANGKPVVETVRLALRLMDEVIRGAVVDISIADDGPFRTTFLLEGSFEALDRKAASFRLFVSAYADLPYLRFWIRLFNDTSADLPVTGLTLEFTLPASPQSFRVPSGDVQPGFQLVQRSEKARELNGAPVDPGAPMFVAWEGGALCVRNFRELYPKQAGAVGQTITLDLIAAKGSPIIFTPGEAKSHEIWLAVGKVDPARFAGAVHRPPILQNAAYYCATGVLGPARPHEGVPVLHEHMTQDFGNIQWEDLDQGFGVRDFPDSPYYGGLPNWSNNYYERMLNLWSEWFMSGDRRWYDLAGNVCRHLMDVAIVHSEVPGKEWKGALHGPGANHVSGPWPPTLRIAGLALYARLTGDPDALDDALGVADYCLRTRAGIDAPSVRNQAGPFDAIYTAYDETGEPQYLDDGAQRVESVLRTVDRRRGAWPEEHGSKVYRGNVPWMVAQLARPLYLWYRATGDVEAAQALVGLAESIICENTDWDQPGVVSGYSHNPHFKVSATYDPLIIPVICAAFELTSDAFFLDAARAQWQRWTREKAFDSPLNCHWNTPWLVWYLKEYHLTEPESPPPAASNSTPEQQAAPLPGGRGS